MWCSCCLDCTYIHKLYYPLLYFIIYYCTVLLCQLGLMVVCLDDICGFQQCVVTVGNWQKN